jgi:hypothetical protein
VNIGEVSRMILIHGGFRSFYWCNGHSRQGAEGSNGFHKTNAFALHSLALSCSLSYSSSHNFFSQTQQLILLSKLSNSMPVIWYDFLWCCFCERFTAPLPPHTKVPSACWNCKHRVCLNCRLVRRGVVDE